MLTWLVLLLLLSHAHCWIHGRDDVLQTEPIMEHSVFEFTETTSSFSVSYSFPKTGGVLMMCPSRGLSIMSLASPSGRCSSTMWREWGCACPDLVNISDTGSMVNYHCPVEPEDFPLVYSIYSVVCGEDDDTKPFQTLEWEGKWAFFDGENPLDVPRKLLPYLFVGLAGFAFIVEVMFIISLQFCCPGKKTNPVRYFIHLSSLGGKSNRGEGLR